MYLHHPSTNTRLCGIKMAPYWRVQPQANDVNGITQQELASVYESAAAVKGENTLLLNQLYSSHRSQAQPRDWSAFCQVCMSVCVCVLPFPDKVPPLWQSTAPQPCLSSYLITACLSSHFVKFPQRRRYLRQYPIPLPESRAAACAVVYREKAICLLKPCNSISGHPTHSGRGTEMCHPLITAFQVLVKFCSSVGKRVLLWIPGNTPPAISTSGPQIAVCVCVWFNWIHLGSFWCSLPVRLEASAHENYVPAATDDNTVWVMQTATLSVCYVPNYITSIVTSHWAFLSLFCQLNRTALLL